MLQKPSSLFTLENWNGMEETPEKKTDALNTALDFGYTMLFNYIECFVRLFGFDPYIGVYHRLWHKRKSLICDLIEPFRCIIEHTTRTAFNRKQFTKSDYIISKDGYNLKPTKVGDYCKVYMDALIVYKKDVFKYIQNYYRSFIRGKETEEFPKFNY